MRSKHERRLHDRLLAIASDHGWRTGPWKAAFRQMLRDDEWSADADEVLEVLGIIRSIPDAWRIRVEGEEQGWGYDVLILELLEVEVTHPVSRLKLAAYEKLWWAMDATSLYHLRVYRMDRYGNVLPLLDETSAAAFFAARYTGGDEDILYKEYTR